MKRKLDNNDAPTVEVPRTTNGISSPETFESLGLDPRLLQAVSKSQFSQPTPVQARVIPPALQGRDLLAKSETGTGKTAAYILPCIQSILQNQTTGARATTVLVLAPTDELSSQITKAFSQFSEFCGKAVRALNLTQKITDAALASKLNETPDVIVSTPGKVAKMLVMATLALSSIRKLVIDEADLVLSYGHGTDVETIRKALPSGVQTILVSATLTSRVDQLRDTFCKDPVVVDVDMPEEKSENLRQFVVKCSEDEKFLLLFVIFKLKLVQGKTIIFVYDVDRSYKVKLYLEQFGIKSCILNSELPVNSRLHVVQEFNKGLYDILIAADDQEVVGGIQKKPKRIEHSGKDDSGDDEVVNEVKSSKTSQDYGVSRGIDFQNVACVLNFDLPTSSRSYTHRIGRTSRAGKSGMALSFVVPREHFGKHKHSSVASARHDEKVLEKIQAKQAKKGREILDYRFNMQQVEGFRYRMNDALRAVSNNTVREARTREIKQELLKSEKLQKHFEENPDDLKALRHDTSSGAVMRVQGHLKHVPDYLLPGKAKKVSGDTGFVSFNKDDSARKKRRLGSRAGRKPGTGRKIDPLKSFKARKQKRTK